MEFLCLLDRFIAIGTFSDNLQFIVSDEGQTLKTTERLVIIDYKNPSAIG